MYRIVILAGTVKMTAQPGYTMEELTCQLTRIRNGFSLISSDAVLQVPIIVNKKRPGIPLSVNT